MKVHFTSLGCPRNLVDSEVMLGILLKAGFESTEVREEADYLVVNTCGFLDIARKEGCDTIEELLRQKKKDAKVVVAGCMVQKNRDELKERFPGIHYFLGSGDMEKIIDAVNAPIEGEVISSAKSYLESGEIPRKLSTPGNYAYLKIAEGCLKRCSFCIIPKIKGKLRSKPQAQVLKEFRALLKQGVFEIILIAQDLGDFGKERHEKQALAALLREMLKIKGDYWIRLLYLYPDEIDDEIIELLANNPRLCPYLDMPIQHINNDMLKAMNRKTSREQIIEIITKLRARIPGVVIRTSLMVGFPGETAAQFKELVEFVKEAQLDNVGIFKYSKEKESDSAKLPGHLSEAVKDRRFKALTAAQQEAIAARYQKYIGRTLQVIIEGYHPESEYLMCGRFYGQCPEIDGQVIINDIRGVKEFGKIYPVKISQVAGYDLVGAVALS